MSAIGDWLFYQFGASGTGSRYGVLSGAGGDVGELGILGGLYLVIRKYNCHEKGCWRWPARHELVDPDTHETHLLCGKHHPRGAPTHEHIADIVRRIEAHKQAGGYARHHDPEPPVGSFQPAPPTGDIPPGGDQVWRGRDAR